MDEGVIITFMQWESTSKGRETRLIEEGRSAHCSSAPLCSLLLKFQTREKVPRAALDVAGCKECRLTRRFLVTSPSVQKQQQQQQKATQQSGCLSLSLCHLPLLVMLLHSEIKRFQNAFSMLCQKCSFQFGNSILFIEYFKICNNI